MSNKEEFKKFILSHPEFIDYVKKNNLSWQSLYELYDLYGDNMDIWNKYINDNKIDSINLKGILNTLKMINLDSLEENISSIQKAISLVEELTKKESSEEVEVKEDKIDDIYGDKDE